MEMNPETYAQLEDVRGDTGAETSAGESSAGAAGSSKRKWRSIVWEYFDRKNQKEVYCNICRMTIKSTNTTNMMAHLKVYSQKGTSKAEMDAHGKASKQCFDDIQTKTKKTKEEKFQQTVGTSVTPPPTKTRTDELDLVVALYVLLGMHPLRSVETDQGLKLLLGLALRGSYRFPSKTKIQQLVDNIYSDLKKAVQELIRSAQAMAISTDIWRSPSAEGFLVVTGHLIVNFERKQCTLGCKKFEDSHTGAGMANLVFSCLNEYKAATKVTAVVTDAASSKFKSQNVLEATSETTTLESSGSESIAGPLLSYLDEDDGNQIDFVDLDMDLVCVAPAFSEVKCAAHQLQLAIEAALQDKEIQELLQDCRQLVGRFKCSTSNNASWNSTYVMLQTIVEARDALEADTKKSGFGNLQPRQFATIHGLLQILKPLSQATKTIAGELPTEPFQSGISTVIPMVFVLEKQLESMTEKLPVDKAVKAFLKALKYQLHQRFGKLPDFYYAATLLDPRYKDTCFDKDIALRWISTNLNTQMCETRQNLPATYSTSKTSNSDEDFWGLWDKFVRKTSTKDIGTRQWKDEFDSYMRDEFDSYMRDESLDRRSDPLVWWRQKKDKYPILCNLATKIISIPSSSLAYARPVMADLRTGITDENFEKCLFVKLNYQLLVDYVLDEKQKKITESLHL